MALLKVTETIRVDGPLLSYVETMEHTASGAVPISEVVAKGFDGDLTTWTDANTAVVTLDSADHGLTDAMKADAFWVVDGVGYRRTGMTITLVDGAAVSIDGGSGDDLPAQGTPIILAKVGATVINCSIDASALKYLFMQCDKAAVVRTNSATSPQETFHLALGKCVRWALGNGANPLAGDVTTLHMSCAGGSPNDAALADGNFQVLPLQDATP
jgi:hypothetical protein